MTDWKRADTDWFRDAGWGVFTHYLCGLYSEAGTDTPAGTWNAMVDSFDAGRLADQLESVNASYHFITIGQGSGHYCAPNETYDRYVGITPGKCSRRDLIADIHEALAPRNIRLLVYISSGGPWGDQAASAALGWVEPGKRSDDQRLADFQFKWQDVLREWSLRWGTKVSGWWIDGCYRADEMYRHAEPPNFRTFAETLKAGNPDAIVAFNPGVKVPVICHTEYEDYTAGELSGDLPVGGWGLGDNEKYCNFGPIGRFVDGAQYHVLNFLGPWWGAAPPRFPTELVVGYTRCINALEGVVSWDVPIASDGRIPGAFLEQLAAIGRTD